MHVNVRCRAFHGTDDVEIGAAGEAWMDAALQADFGGAAIPSLRRPPRDLLQIQQVAGAAQRPRAALRERAEAAVIETDVGVIDVAVDHVGEVEPTVCARRLSAARSTSLRSAPSAWNSATTSSSSRPSPRRARSSIRRTRRDA